jgi:hypothetical protein
LCTYVHECAKGLKKASNTKAGHQCPFRNREWLCGSLTSHSKENGMGWWGGCKELEKAYLVIYFAPQFSFRREHPCHDKSLLLNVRDQA